MSAVKPLKINIDGITSEIEEGDLIAAVSIVRDAGGHEAIQLSDHDGRVQVISDDLSGILLQILREQKLTNLYLKEMLGDRFSYEDLE